MTIAAELHAWLNGVPDGGPHSDGRYPLTYADGLTYLVYCPAAQALNPALEEQPIEVFANTATAAASTATTAASEATSARLDAITAAANAQSYASTANTHRANAQTAANTANTRANTATSAATTATNARDKAQEWADNNEDVAVETGKFSAKHWAQKALAAAGAIAAPVWANITGIPANITAWAGIAPSAKANTSHSHTIGNVTGLQGELDAIDTDITAQSNTITDLEASVNTKAASARTITAGNGLSGGGNLTANRTITLGTPGTLSGSTTNAVQTSSHTHALSTNLSAWDGVTVASKADSARTISAGNGMSGGGSLASNRTITLGTPGTLSGSTSNAVQTSSHTHALSTNLKAWDGYHPDDAFVLKGTIPGSVDLNTYRTTGIYHQPANANATSGTNYPANAAGMLTVFENSAMTYQTYQIYNTGDVYTRSRYNTSWSVWKLSVDGTTTISAGNGLSGGGTLAANRTITLGTPGTITSSTTNAVQTSSHTHALTIVAGDIPSLPAARITSGSFAAARIPNLNASKITAGTLPIARGGTGGTSKATARTGIGIFVQSGDPGSNAAAGDLWVW